MREREREREREGEELESQVIRVEKGEIERDEKLVRGKGGFLSQCVSMWLVPVAPKQAVRY